MALHHATTLQDDDLDATQAPDPLLTDIEALNRRHAFVMNGGKAMVMNFGRNQKQGETLTFSNQTDFKARYANRSTLVLSEYGTRLAPLADQWWVHPKRRAYAGLVFLPGSPLEVELGDDNPHYNLFRGWPVQPVPGDCSLFWAHLKDIICAGDEERYLYVRRWLAHGIQKPEEMPETSLVLRGGQGTGKGTYAYVGGNPISLTDPTGLDPWGNDPSLKDIGTSDGETCAWLSRAQASGQDPYDYLFAARNTYGLDLHDPNLVAAERYMGGYTGEFSDTLILGQHLLKQARTLPGATSILGRNGSPASTSAFVAKWGMMGNFHRQQGSGVGGSACGCGK